MLVIVRPALEEDAPQMVDLLNGLISQGRYTVMDEPVGLREQVDFIRAFPDRGVFHLAVCPTGQEVLGMQDVQPLSAPHRAFSHVGEVSTFVRPDAQGVGVGGSLCRATFEAVRERGFRKILATVRADNPRAVAFYLGQGFRVIGTAQQHAYVGGNYVDEVLMEKLVG